MRFTIVVLLLTIVSPPLLAQSDTAPPSITSVKIPTPTIKALADSQSVTMDVTGTDDLSGIASIGCFLYSPSGQKIVIGSAVDPNHLVSGTNRNGTYRMTMTIPPFPEIGVWTMTILQARDKALNTLNLTEEQILQNGFPNKITVTNQDVPPQTSTEVLLFPQAVTGASYELVVIVSYKNTGWGGLAWFTPDNYSLRSRLRINSLSPNQADNSFSVSGSGFGTRKFVITSSTNELIVGTLQISSTGSDSVADVAATMFYNVYSGSTLTSTTGVAPASLGTKFLFPVEKSNSINTGLAWTNPPMPYSPPATVKATLFNEYGAQFQQKFVPYAGHISKFFDQIFDGVPASFLGSVLLETGTNPLAIVVLRQQSNPNGTFLFTSTPPNSNIP